MCVELTFPPKYCRMMRLRSIFSIIAVLCAISGFFTAPFMHQHVSDDPDHHSVIHSHFRIHYIDPAAQRGRTAISDPENAHYLDLFDAQTQTQSVTAVFVTTQAICLTLALPVLTTVLTSEARAHSPPPLKQVPARSPPAQPRPVVA